MIPLIIPLVYIGKWMIGVCAAATKMMTATATTIVQSSTTVVIEVAQSLALPLVVKQSIGAMVPVTLAALGVWAVAEMGSLTIGGVVGQVCESIVFYLTVAIVETALLGSLWAYVMRTLTAAVSMVT